MEEKTIIKSERYDVLKKILYGFLIAAAIVLVFMWSYMGCSAWFWRQVEYHIKGDCYKSNGFHIATFCVLGDMFDDDVLIPMVIAIAIPIGLTLLGICIFFLLKSMEIVVTDKRVHGRTYFGKRVDLPLDSVSSVGSAWLKGITVATSSGKISFLLIKNAREIHEEIRKLLIERQEKEKTAQPEKVSAAASVADELKNYKELLDSGIITQEEFDKKKKELLGF